MRRPARAAALALGLALITGTAADSAGQDLAPARADLPATGYDVLPTGGGLEDCGCTGGARARSRIELGLIPRHPPQDVPEIAPSDH
jgi:hypothetical protein